MAIFKISYELLKRWENRETKDGLIVYSNVAGDKGGETVLGVARKMHPELLIWREVDDLKIKLNMNDKSLTNFDLISLSKAILQNKMINDAVESLYKENYWKKLKCDIVENQNFASNLFLLGVNAGIKRAVKTGQQACQIFVDGIIGKNTLNAWKNAGDKECKNFTDIEIEYYKSLAKRDKSQEKFLKGWINRANAV